MYFVARLRDLGDLFDKFWNSGDIKYIIGLIVFIIVCIFIFGRLKNHANKK